MNYHSQITAALLLLMPLALGAQDFEPPEPPGQQQAGSQLRLRHLDFLAQTAAPYEALVYRQRLPQNVLNERAVAPLQVKLADALRELGLLDVASADYRRYLSVQTPDRIRNRAWFNLAISRYNNDEYEKAAAALNNVYGILPEQFQDQRQPLEARLLIRQGRYAEAVKLLRQWRLERNDDPYTRYNLGVALIRNGEIAEGAGELDAIGNMDADSEALRALKDQANLVLAYAYLELGQGATARSLFQRIRLDAPFSDKALLGLGWAELAPDGEPQKYVVLEPIRCIEDASRLLPDSLPGVLRRPPRDACGPPRMFRSTDTFDTRSGGKTPEQRYRRALAAWTELSTQDPERRAVQEVLVAVPYAYQQLGAKQQAQQHYQQAAASLEAQRGNLLSIIEQLQQPAAEPALLPPGVKPNLAWFADQWDLPQSARTRFMADVVTRHHFQQTARNLQDLQVLRDRLATQADSTSDLQRLLAGRRAALARGGYSLPRQLLDEQASLQSVIDRSQALNAKIQSTINQLSEHLRALAIAGAREHQRYLDTYLAKARLGELGLLEQQDEL